MVCSSDLIINRKNFSTDSPNILQRVVILSYDKETNQISFRHYSIVAQPCGVTKSVKALVGRRQLPDLGSLQDVSDYLTKSGYGSVSHCLLDLTHLLLCCLVDQPKPSYGVSCK